MVGSLKGRREGRELVEEAAQSPDVALLVVLELVDHLRGHVEGRPHVGVGEFGLAGQLLGEAEVADLDVRGTVQEDVAGLEVAVEDGLGLASAVLVAVALLECHEDLRENLPDELLVDCTPVLARTLDHGAEVSALAELHHDVQARRGLVDDAVVVPDDEGVLELAEDVDLERGGGGGG